VRYALLALLPVALVHALTGVGLFCSSGYCLAVWQHEAALYGPDGKFLTGWEFNADLRSGAIGNGMFAVGSEKGTVWVFDFKGNLIKKFSAEYEHNFWPITPTDYMLLLGGPKNFTVVGYDAFDGVVSAFDKAGNLLWEVDVDSDVFRASKLVRYGGYVLFVDVPQNMLVYIKDGQIVRTESFDHLVGADACGPYLAVRTTDYVAVYKGPELLWQKEMPIIALGKVATVAFSPDCSELAVYEFGFLEGKMMKVFDVQTGLLEWERKLPFQPIDMGWLGDRLVLMPKYGKLVVAG